MHFLLLLAGEVKALVGVLFLFIKIIEFFFVSEKKTVAALQFYAGYEKHAIVILLSLCYTQNQKSLLIVTV